MSESEHGYQKVLAAGIDFSDGKTPINLTVDPATGRLRVDLGGAVINVDGITVLDDVEAVPRGAGADVFGADVGVGTNDGVVLVEFTADTAGILKFDIARDAATISSDFNQGIALLPNTWYAWEIPVKAGDDLNMNLSAAATVTAMLSLRTV